MAKERASVQPPRPASSPAAAIVEQGRLRREQLPHSQTRLGNRLTLKAKARKTHDDLEAEERERCVVQHAEAAAGMAVDEAAPEEPIHCIFCGSRRRLQFTNGKRGRAACGSWAERRSKRRRLNWKQPDPEGLFTSIAPIHLDKAVAQEDALGHILMASDDLNWCFRCGAFSSERIHGLGALCNGAPGAGQAFRLKRLKANRHPLSNMSSSSVAKRLRTS